jgi:gamma-glutamyltranspeptidase/glutathione hydrolase
MTAIPEIGWDPVTVPGAVSAWVMLSERFGRLPFTDLFTPAISYARDGFPVSPIIALSWQGSMNTFKKFPGFCSAFLIDGKRAPRIGEVFKCPDTARSLELIARTKGRAFYHGELAAAMAAYARKTKGLLTAEDLATHVADWVEPISVEYRGYRLHEIPPNGQGLAALLMLGILEHWSMGDFPVDSADSLHVQIEAMKLAFADAHRYIADPQHMDVKVSALLDPAYLKKRAQLIDLKHAQAPACGVPQAGDTVYLTAADASGMMVSFIQSNYGGFGSGIVVPGTGISFQNRGRGFSLQPGHPNQVAGGKRPYHTIIPGFLTKDGKPVMSFGVMGGHMQPQGHAQMVVRLADYGQNPQAASDAPRWHVLAGLEVELEKGTDPAVVRELVRRGHVLCQPGTCYFGGAQLIYKLDDGYCAASDHRKDGQAVGF